MFTRDQNSHYFDVRLQNSTFWKEIRVRITRPSSNWNSDQVCSKKFWGCIHYWIVLSLSSLIILPVVVSDELSLLFFCCLLHSIVEIISYSQILIQAFAALFLGLIVTELWNAVDEIGPVSVFRRNFYLLWRLRRWRYINAVFRIVNVFGIVLG